MTSCFIIAVVCTFAISVYTLAMIRSKRKMPVYKMQHKTHSLDSFNWCVWSTISYT